MTHPEIRRRDERDAALVVTHAGDGAHLRKRKKKKKLILTKLHIPTRCDSIRCPSKSQISHHLLCVTHRRARHNNPGEGRGVVRQRTAERDGCVGEEPAKNSDNRGDDSPPLNATCHQGANHTLHYLASVVGELLFLIQPLDGKSPPPTPPPLKKRCEPPRFCLPVN